MIEQPTFTLGIEEEYPRDTGASPDEAPRAVVDMLIEATLRGV